MGRNKRNSIKRPEFLKKVYKIRRTRGSTKYVKKR